MWGTQDFIVKVQFFKSEPLIRARSKKHGYHLSNTTGHVCFSEGGVIKWELPLLLNVPLLALLWKSSSWRCGHSSNQEGNCLPPFPLKKLSLFWRPLQKHLFSMEWGEVLVGHLCSLGPQQLDLLPREANLLFFVAQVNLRARNHPSSKGQNLLAATDSLKRTQTLPPVGVAIVQAVWPRFYSSYPVPIGDQMHASVIVLYQKCCLCRNTKWQLSERLKYIL